MRGVAGAIDLREFTPGDGFSVGPFGVRSWLLPHMVPNAGLRLEADGRVLAYVAGKAGAGQLVLTHLIPGTDPDDSVLAAAEGYAGPIAVASPGLMVEAGR
jgi:hypothetical protein